VPVTVLSRCLQFNLRPMAPETIQQHLQTVLGAEAIAADAGALRLIARNARGSMRDALSLADQAIAFGAGALVEAGVRQMLGAVDRSHVQRIVQCLAASDGAGLVAVVDGLRRLGLSAAGTLEELAAVTQQMALLQALPQAGDDNDPDTPMLRELAASLASDETQLLYSIALHGRAELGLAPDEYSGLTMVLLRALAFRPPGAKRAEPIAAPIVAPGGAAGDASRNLNGGAAGAFAGVSAGGSAGGPTGGLKIEVTPGAPAAPAVDRAGPPPAATGRSRELLRTPALPSVAAVELTPPAAVVAALRAPATLRAAEPTPEPTPEPSRAPKPAPTSEPTPGPAPGPTPGPMPVRAAASLAVARREQVSASDEPAWLRADDPPSDADSAAPWAGPVDTPPWDDEPADLAPAPVQRSAGAALARPNRLLAREAHEAYEPREPSPGAAAPAAAPVADAGAVPVARVDDPVTGRWVALLQPLFDAARLSGFVRELAWQSQCVACEGADAGTPAPLRVVLRVARESLRQTQLRERLQAALIEHLGRPVSLEVTSGAVEDSAALREAAARARRQADAEAFVHNHPLVKSLLAAIPGARVLPGSIRPN
jgi:DNA polymerase-3 subunit gamma/tau